MDAEVLTEIPEVLKKLVRLIVRGFYSLEHTIVIDLLVRNPCMKDDDIIDLLKFDTKQLRSIMTVLKNDKFLKVFVNMVKYRLDHMRRKIETDERDNTSRASFKCLNCLKTFTDLEADQLFDFMTGTFICTYCKTEVVEDESSVKTSDARTLLMKYNEQIQPIYDLLRDCEDIKLSPELLEPEPTDLRHIKSDKPTSTHSRERSGWSGEATKSTSFGYAERTVTVSVGEQLSPVKDSANPAKETPVWMQESTVQGANVTIVNEESAPASQTSVGGGSVNEDIMKTLLAHEKKTTKMWPQASGSGDEGSTSESDDEMKPVTNDERDEEAMDDDVMDPPVPVDGRFVPYSEITTELVALMTEDEKEHYIKVGQEYYARLYE